MIRELDRVVLTRDMQDHGLKKGSRGAVVHCYSDGEGFEVEFLDVENHDSAVITLERADIQLEREAVHEQILEILRHLPEDLVAEVRDFAEFLHQRQNAR